MKFINHLFGYFLSTAEGEDFVRFENEEVTFLAGATMSIPITITGIPDNVVENLEDLNVFAISDNARVRISNEPLNVGIVDDDGMLGVYNCC